MLEYSTSGAHVTHSILSLGKVASPPPKSGDPSTIYSAGVLVPCFKATGINVLLKSAIDSNDWVIKYKYLRLEISKTEQLNTILVI